MDIKMLWGQRKCLYAGQYFPELLETFDEYAEEENPDYMDEKYKEYFESNEFDDLRFAEISIPDEVVLKLFKNPKLKFEYKGE